jgi:hypothetical protein
MTLIAVPDPRSDEFAVVSVLAGLALAACGGAPSVHQSTGTTTTYDPVVPRCRPQALPGRRSRVTSCPLGAETDHDSRPRTLSHADLPALQHRAAGADHCPRVRAFKQLDATSGQAVVWTNVSGVAPQKVVISQEARPFCPRFRTRRPVRVDVEVAGETSTSRRRPASSPERLLPAVGPCPGIPWTMRPAPCRASDPVSSLSAAEISWPFCSNRSPTVCRRVTERSLLVHLKLVASALDAGAAKKAAACARAVHIRQ